MKKRDGKELVERETEQSQEVSSDCVGCVIERDRSFRETRDSSRESIQRTVDVFHVVLLHGNQTFQ